MVRLHVVTTDAGLSVHVGGPVHVTHRSFDIEAPELEAFMAEAETWTGSYCQRSILGVEVIEDSPRG